MRDEKLSAGPVLEQSRGIAFDEWKLDILGCHDIDELMITVRAYLAAWPRQDLSALPSDIAGTFIEGPDDLMAKAVLASRAEMTITTPSGQARLLREMALTLSAAATRARSLRVPK